MPKFSLGTPCVYCNNSPEDITRDHIPPKCLFAKGEIGDPIIVPACLECHRSFAKDDEYFRQILGMDEKALESHAGQEVSKTALRAVQYPHHRKMLEAMMPNFVDVADWTGGIYRGTKAAYLFDASRIEKTIARIVKGLFWYENKEVLPHNYGISVFRYEKLDKYNISLQSSLANLYQHCIANGIRSVGDKAFEYAFSTAEENLYASCWILRFRESIHLDFIAFTVLEDGPS